MDIIRCENCGHYQLNNGDLCHGCQADFSEGAKYTVVSDQKLAHERWDQLDEDGYNQYMESIVKFTPPAKYMICPNCRFKMLITEHTCPSCGIPVMYVKPSKKKRRVTDNMSLTYKVLYYFFDSYVKIVLWGSIILFIVAMFFLFLRS